MQTQGVLAPLLLAAYAVPYAWRARTLRRRGRPVPAWRRWCFAGAVALLTLAVIPPADHLADTRLSAHMAEHLIIGDIAPLLAVLGCSGPMLAPLLRTRSAERLRGLAHPVVAFVLWAADLYLWHLPFAYQAALHHDVVHVLQHACFFAFGFNLWLPLFGPLPKPAWFGTGAQVSYVVAVRIAGFALGNALTWAHVEFYPYYGHALGDQSAAGAVMMLEQMVVMLALFAWLLARLLREAGERQELAELAGARGVALDERRIARAVTAGRAGALRERVERGSPR
jgi:cytochrome c oxidase assembly factor CtaG